MTRREDWQRPEIWVAWGLVGAFAALVLWLGGGSFSAKTTSLWLKPIVSLFYPEVSAHELSKIHSLVRKLAHLVEYAVLALLAFRAARLTLRTVLARIVATAILVALAVAGIDELRQSMLSDRTGSVLDVLLDASGAILAAIVAAAFHRRRGAPTAGEAAT
jgi:VanZ family protein